MKLLGITKNGVPVYDRKVSHVHTPAENYLEDLLRKCEFTQPFVNHSFDYGYTIGENDCVKTSDKDVIYYAQRQNRKGLTRFVKNREPEPTNFVTIVMKFDKAGSYYVMITAFVGKKAEPEIWDLNSIRRDARGFDAAMEASLQFWAKHALIKN